MDELQILIQAILSLKDTTKSKQQILSELPKLEKQLQSDSKAKINITAGLDITKSKNLIQAQLNTLANQAKAPTIQIGIDTSSIGTTQSITNSLKNVQTQAQQTASAINEVTTSITADNISNKMVSEFQKSFNIVGKNAKNTQQTFKELFAELNNAWYSGNEEKYLKVLEQIYDIAQKTTKVVKQSKSEISALTDQIRSELTDGSKAFISPQVRKELEYLLGTSKQIQSVLSTVYGVGKWSFSNGRATDILANGDKGILGQADEIVEAYSKIQSIKSSSEYTILDSFDRDRESIDNCMRSVLNLSNAYRDLNGVEHTYIQGLGWFESIDEETQDIKEETVAIEKQTKATEKLKAIRESITRDVNGQQISRTSVYGDTGFTRTSYYNEKDELTSYTDTENYQKLEQQLAKIEEVRAKYNRLLSDFKSSNSAIQSGLTQPIEQFEKVLNSLGKTSSINDVKNAFESLKQSASEITQYLDTTNSSFNKATNAVNNYKNMDNILKEMTASFNNLVMKPENLRTELDGVKSKLIELQNLEKTEGGYTKAWAEKYREVNLELAQVKTNIELALKAEGSSQKANKNSAYQTQLKYLNKIKEETNTIISLKRKMVNAGDEEKSVYQHEITNAQKRIQYDVQQLDKKKLLTDEAKRLVNTYKEQIALQDKINSAKTSDKNVQAQSQQLKDYVTQVSKAITQLNALQNSTTFNKNASNPRATQTKQEIAQLLVEYQKLMTQMQGDITPAGLETLGSELNKLNTRFNSACASAEQFERELKDDNSAEKLAKNVSVLTARIEAFRKANRKSEKLFGSQYDAILSELSNPNIDLETYNRLVKEFQTLRLEINKADKAGQSFFGKLKDQATKFASWMTLTGIIAGAWRNIQKMVSEVVELDSAMSNLKKVTDETDIAYSKFLKNSIQQARDLKMDLSDLVDQTAEWAKKGYSINESAIASQASGIYSVVGEVDNATSVQDLTTVIKSYNMAVEESMDIVDKFNNISNKYSVTAGDIGEMLSNSISSLSVAGNSLDEAIAMGTTITEITGDASEAGNTLKVLSMRLRGASTEIENMGESTDGMAESTSKLREKVLALTNVNGTGGFDIMADSENFKSTYQIMQGISEVWEDISDVNQAALIELIAGKQRGNTVSALLTNMAQANNILTDSLNSSGSAMKEYNIYLDSLPGKIQGIKTEFSALSETLIDDNSLKGLLDVATSFLKYLTDIIDNLGLINTLGLSVATVLSFKNVGELQNKTCLLTHCCNYVRRYNTF